ncbi:MAG TPA: S41 family peptidase, partial [Saprospiraceae bacterium]|nr:S41 family peptidase [Saprospiraceae bacterium]
MKTIHPFFFLLLLSTSIQAQSCPCTEQFDWLRQKLALNYSGYRDKVTPQNQAEFDRHTADFQAKVAESKADSTCLRLLTEWARWFRDGHVQLFQKAAPAADDPAEIRRRFAGWEKIALTEVEARAYLDRPDRDPVEGIYRNAEGNYRVAVIKDSNSERDFAGVLLNADSVWWMPGQVKFDLKKAKSLSTFMSRYYMRDHSERNPSVTFTDGKLEFADLGTWHKQYPGIPSVPAKPQIFTLAKLDSQTLLLTVPTMNETVRKELDSLVQANAALLERTPHLIIDCRDNGGGSDITFDPLKPYVYSGPVKGYRGQIYATDDNIDKYEKLRHSKDFPQKYRLYFGHIAHKMRKHKGEFVGKCGEATEKSKKVKPYPLRVAILINGNCASSCEQFIYYADQSTRVTLIGQNTAGILDYGNLHNLDFPCGKFGLAYPTSRSCRVDAGKGIDGVGIPPDVKIDAQEKDWVEFARQYLKK